MDFEDYVRQEGFEEYRHMIRPHDYIINFVFNENRDNWCEFTLHGYEMTNPMVIVPFDVWRCFTRGRYDVRCSREFYEMRDNQEIFRAEVFPGNDINFEDHKHNTCGDEIYGRNNRRLYLRKRAFFTGFVINILNLLFNDEEEVHAIVTYSFYPDYESFSREHFHFHMEQNEVLPERSGEAIQEWRHDMRVFIINILGLRV